MLISIYQKNAHGTRASAIVAKTELLAAETKSFNHNIQDVNKFITSKNKEIAFGGESNHDALFQVFKIYESCPVPKFQETISELRRKYNRNDESISTELIMAEALTTYDTLILEKDWITYDPKSVVFANLLKKAESTFKRFENKNPKSEPNPTKKKKKNQKSFGYPDWKFVAPTDGVKTIKKNDRTYHWRHHPHGREGKPMWGVHKPSEHEGSNVEKKTTPNSESSVELELADDLRSLLATIQSDFS